MRRINNKLNILKCNSGISLVFVLAVLFLLFAITTSVLVAAGAGFGAVQSQWEHNRVLLLDDSIHRNILHSLQPPDSTDETDYLSVQLVRALHEAGGLLGEIDIDISGFEITDDDSDLTIESVRLTFPVQSVRNNNATRRNAIWNPGYYVHADSCDGSDHSACSYHSPTIARYRDARVSYVDATMIVTVEINSGGRITRSRAEYVYSGNPIGVFSDDPNGLCYGCPAPSNVSYSCAGRCTDDKMHLINPGEWRLVRRDSAY
jgi:hypothetical protein